MSRRLGDHIPSDTITFEFNTFNGTALASLAGSPALKCYKDADTTGTTSGITLSVDNGGLVGVNKVVIDLSANTSYYSSGGRFSLRFTAGTNGTVTVVNMEVAYFTIGRQTVPQMLGAGPCYPLGITDSGTAQAATSNSLTLRAANTLGTDVPVGSTAMITTGATAGQTGLGADFDTTTDVDLLSAGWSSGTTPTGTPGYILFATAPDASAAAPTVAQIKDGILAGVVEGTTTVQGSLMISNAALGGKVSGLPTAPVFRDLADSKARITATTDANGNRTVIVRDLT